MVNLYISCIDLHVVMCDFQNNKKCAIVVISGTREAGTFGVLLVFQEVNFPLR